MDWSGVFTLVFAFLCALPIIIVALLLLFGEIDSLTQLIDSVKNAIIAIIEATKKRKNDY